MLSHLTALLHQYRPEHLQHAMYDRLGTSTRPRRCDVRQDTTRGAYDLRLLILPSVRPPKTSCVGVHPPATQPPRRRSTLQRLTRATIQAARLPEGHHLDHQSITTTILVLEHDAMCLSLSDQDAFGTLYLAALRTRLYERS